MDDNNPTFAFGLRLGNFVTPAESQGKITIVVNIKSMQRINSQI